MSASNERLCFNGAARAVGHEPRRLLRHADMLGELGAGNALLLRSNEPDSQHTVVQSVSRRGSEVSGLTEAAICNSDPDYRK